MATDTERDLALPAVFSRNWPQYLEEAVEIDERAPGRLVSFRSHVPWKSAADLLQTHGPIPIYFAENDGNGRVTHVARLRDVVLRPESGDAATERLMKYRPKRTSGDEWEEGKGTLYAISDCRRVDRPFAQHMLLKWNDGEPIDTNYSRSYCLVRARETEAAEDEPAGEDVANPPTRFKDVQVRRIVRDTKLIRLLKRLHEDRCQLCATQLRLVDGRSYSEGHHLQPLGGEHRGPDVAENVIVVCPNCHALCDLASVTLSRAKIRAHPDHSLGTAFLDYHNRLVKRRRGE